MTEPQKCPCYGYYCAGLPTCRWRRSCTCHPDERPPVCQQKYAFSECMAIFRANVVIAIFFYMDHKDHRRYGRPDLTRFRDRDPLGPHPL